MAVPRIGRNSRLNSIVFVHRLCCKPPSIPSTYFCTWSRTPMMTIVPLCKSESFFKLNSCPYSFVVQRAVSTELTYVARSKLAAQKVQKKSFCSPTQATTRLLNSSTLYSNQEASFSRFWRLEIESNLWRLRQLCEVFHPHSGWRAEDRGQTVQGRPRKR